MSALTVNVLTAAAAVAARQSARVGERAGARPHLPSLLARRLVGLSRRLRRWYARHIPNQQLGVRNMGRGGEPLLYACDVALDGSSSRV